MIKSLKSVGALLFLSTFCNGTVYATQVEKTADVKVVQQNGTCTGVVKDATGETVIGASVLVKGSTNGTITGIDGDFSLSNVPRGSVIVISFVGYQTQEVKWTGTPLNIVLKDDSKLLDEVVVVGYGTQKKVNVTGAVSMVNSDVIESRPVANVSQALQGAIPGLNLSASSSGGDLNTSMSINIRGTGSIGNGSVDRPLILIDGIEGDLNSLNPNDVESVSVLKDAASASIYGSRAAFGVILVTTKSGKAGKVKVTYSGDVRFSTATQVPKMANSLQFATYFNAANVNAGGSNIFTDETMENIKKYMNGEFTDPSRPEYWGTTANPSNGKWNNYGSAFANTDWFNEFYKKNVPSTQHNLSLSGGNEKFNWSVSGSFLLQNGLIAHGHADRVRSPLHSKIG
ncbi:MAG: SusC/RagA family TonB-linked outer membrane protein, partial [Bacteroides sp.]|nr:SusC/RagA family TonB-linked outer membrane protein [Bacteroides sp.]